ncbi:C2H2 finger domain transcription factor [Aspergillus melleus]|uniref:C2H2 finger domain transcription factor n=1 Tax=Aspergillus melleus TaxID=138277 RepID=UPI001E8D1618|nr:uncharacterized protein LDX57_006834 [Aspergillus melleus]KAH8429165.1 hypothetical protein LDX57_006834 [Aspergillus melleus]
MKTHACQWPNCQKTFTRAEHLRRHALNHEQARNGYTCERCSVHFNRPDLLSRHMLRHAKRDEEAGGPGLGVLETRKRTRRAGDGSIVTRPAKRQARRPSHATASLSDDTDHPPHGAPVSPPGSASDHPSLSLDETDPLLAPMMAGGPFEPFVEPIPGQFDAADGSWSLGLEPQGLADGFGLDTATDFNMPFAATHNYNWLFDVASLDDAFHQLDVPLGPDMMTFADALDTPPASLDLPDADQLLDQDGSSVLLQAASFVERNRDINLTLSPLDMDWMGPNMLDPSPAPHLPRLTEEVRQGILSLVTHDPVVLAQVDTLLSLASLQNYSDLFFTRFNTVYPLVHQPTFDPTTLQPVFMASILCMGATYSTREAHQLAVSLHGNLRTQLFCNEAFSPSPDLWVLQTMLLIDCFGKMRAGPKQRETAQLFHCVLIKLIRRSGCCTVRANSPDLSASGIEQETGDLNETWRKAMEAEQRKRLAMQCFMWDTQHAVLFSQSLCMSAFEIRSALPCSSAVWEASTAEEWMRSASREPESHSFLSVLKGYITPGSVTRPRDLNPLARLLVLHGLMSVSADLKRRDQTTIRDSPERVGVWTRRMGRSYDLWKIDFDADCLSSKLCLSQSPTQPSTFTDPDIGRLTSLKSSAHALYRAAHIALNVEILDLQIAAGTTQILSRGVTDSDRARSLHILPRWLQTDSSITAARHAAHLLQDAILTLQDWEQTDAFHFPWCLYLATLTCWAFHFHARAEDRRGPGHPGQGRITTDISSLIVAMTSCEGDELASLGGKYETRGLVMAMAQQLAGVRWGVVHDAMKVLVNMGSR